MGAGTTWETVVSTQHEQVIERKWKRGDGSDNVVWARAGDQSGDVGVKRED